MGRLISVLLVFLFFASTANAQYSCPVSSDITSCASPDYNSVTVNNLNMLNPLGLAPLSADPGSPTAGNIYYNSATGLLRYYNGVAAAWQPVGSGGSGTVSSVGLSLPSIFSVTVSPITASGSLTAILANEPINQIFAGPSSGSAAAPAFRSLVAADLPVATSSSFGAGKCDGTTITCAGGIFSATGGGSGYALPDIIGTYHADPTGATDSTTAFQNAGASGTWVVVEGGTYKISGTVAISSNAYLVGGGTAAVTITSASTTLPMFSFANGVNNAGISGMTITRSVTPSSGAFGIVSAHTGPFDDVERITLANLNIENQWNGLSLGPTNYSVIRDLVVEKNLSDGVDLFNTIGSSGAGSNPLQWTLDHVLSQFNVGHGFELSGLLNSQIKSGTPISVGEWKNLSTFGNTGGGIAILGSTASPFWGVRLGSNSFIGGDGSTEVYIDSFGGNHLIDADVELAGQAATGPAGATPPSDVGYGIFVSANNSGVNIHADVNANSYDGIYCAANLYGALTAPCQVTGSQVTNNGVAAVSGAQNGVTLASGSGGGMVISGGYIGCWNENPGSCPQLFGLNIATDKISSVGARIVGANNASAPIFVSVSLTAASCLDSLAGGTCFSGGGGAVSSVVGATGAITLGNLVSGGVAPLASAGLTGVPTAPTAPGGTNTTQLATTAFVQSAISGSGGCSFTLAPLSGGGLTTSPATIGCTSSGADIYITPIANNTFLANTSGSLVSPVANNISTFMDSAVSATNGVIFNRAGGAWTASTPATLGLAPLASPAFTGSNPTYDSGSGPIYLALTPTAGLSNPGYIAFPISNTAFNYQRQWGNATISSGTSVAVTFPNTCAHAILGDPQVTVAASGGVQVAVAAGNVTLSGFTIFAVNSATGGSVTSQPFNWSVECY